MWAQFTDIAIMGDSRAMGFSSYNLVDESHVFAALGGTIRDIDTYTDQLVSLNPSNIILCYGLNDVGYWSSVNDYLSDLDKTIEELQTLLPQAIVYVNSIIPVTSSALESYSKEVSERIQDIPDWNEAISQHCEDNSIPYIDITEEVETHRDLYDVDGIHMQKAFYEYWAIDMITEVTENE